MLLLTRLKVDCEFVGKFRSHQEPGRVQLLHRPVGLVELEEISGHLRERERAKVNMKVTFRYDHISVDYSRAISEGERNFMKKQQQNVFSVKKAVIVSQGSCFVAHLNKQLYKNELSYLVMPAVRDQAKPLNKA